MGLFSKLRAGSFVSRYGRRSDEELYTMYARLGDHRAFEALLARYGDKVYGYFLRFFGDKNRAEDLAQETFLRLVRTSGSFRGDSKFSTYLFRIVRNLCIDTLRGGKNQKKQASIEDCGEQAGRVSRHEPVGSSHNDTSRASQTREALQALEEALAKLPQEQREVFLLREVQGLKFKEIAEVVGANENTVKSRMRYALEFLRQHLEEYVE